MINNKSTKNGPVHSGVDLQIPDRIEKVDIQIKQLLMAAFKKDIGCLHRFLNVCTNAEARSAMTKYWSSIPIRLIKKQCNKKFANKDSSKKKSNGSVNSKEEPSMHLDHIPEAVYSIRQATQKVVVQKPETMTVQHPRLINKTAPVKITVSQKPVREIFQPLPSEESRTQQPKPTEPAEEMKCEEVPWEAVYFSNGSVWLYNSRLNGEVLLKSKGHLTIPCQNSRESFNQIKKLFAQRLPKIKAYVKNNYLEKVVSEPDIWEVVRILKEIETYEDWGYNDNKIVVTSSLRALQAIDNEKLLRELRKRKSKYLDYLVSKQELHRKVVPCYERLCYDAGETTEEAFIFTIKSTHLNHELLVVENVNIARSTIVFVVNKISYNKALRVVFDFLRSDEKNKRQRLHYNRFDFNGGGIRLYACINHSTMLEWASKLRRM